MGRSRYYIYEEYYPYFITSSVVVGLPLFMDAHICSILLDDLKYVQEENAILLYAYVIMPNHIHMIIEGKNLSAKLRAFKSHTARRIVDYLILMKKRRTLTQLRSFKLDNHKDSEFQIWQEGYHPKQLTSHEMLEQKLNYIHFNPVKAGYVSQPTHWRYSSAINYEGKEGLIPITCFPG